ncbi:unnamed protein product [Laminaria digitata]
MGRSCQKCGREETFNFEGSKPAAFCKKHAEDGMVDVRNRRCLYDSCTTRPSYNFEGIKPGAYCKLHAEDGMVDVRNKCCLYDSFTKVPSFNFEGAKPAAYCKQQTEDMVDVCGPRRLQESCTKRLGYSAGKTTASCKQHVDDEMVDVHSKCCSHESCSKIPTSNIESNKTGAYCKRNTEDGIVDVGSRRCLHDTCTKQPYFNFEGRKYEYCKFMPRTAW